MNKGRCSRWGEGAGHHPKLPKLVVTAAAKKINMQRRLICRTNVYEWAIYIRWTMARIDDLQLRHNWVVMNPTVMQHIVTYLRIQNTWVTAESEISLSMSGFMCRPMTKKFKVWRHTCLYPLFPVTDRHTFLDPLPLERDILSGRPHNNTYIVTDSQ